jgi:protein-S-isoprenylcysteine O-methyltransferase Ste14
MATRRLLRYVFPIVPVLGGLGLLLPPALLALTPPFPGRVLGAALFMAAAAEKIWAMYFRMRDARLLKPEGDWTSVTIGLSHTLIMYGVVLEFFLRRRGFAFPAWTAAGLALYGAALGLRYWAFRELKEQWAIHVDRSLAARTLVTTGPYRWIRHPLYLGACLEIAGVPLMLNAFWAAAAGVLLFTPLEIGRIVFEERHLRAIFGAAYDDYAARTGALFPKGARK